MSMPRIQIGPFSLMAPAGWMLSSIILAGPVSEAPPVRAPLAARAVRPFQRNVIATMERVAAGQTPHSYVQRQIEGLWEAGVEREEARPPERVQLEGGLEGLITEQVITTSDGERVRQMQLVCIKEDVAHTIIASHLDGAPFEAVREEFRSMLLSFA